MKHLVQMKKGHARLAFLYNSSSVYYYLPATSSSLSFSALTTLKVTFKFAYRRSVRDQCNSFTSFISSVQKSFFLLSYGWLQPLNFGKSFSFLFSCLRCLVLFFLKPFVLLLPAPTISLCLSLSLSSIQPKLRILRHATAVGQNTTNYELTE